MDKISALHTLLQEALPLAAFEGWNEHMVKQACKNTNISESEYIRICPNGAIDLIEAWIKQADEAMVAFATKENISGLKVRERIKQLILFRLDYVAEHREALRRACHLLAMPQHTTTNLRLLHQTVDTMWRLAGDTANDYNWYTKRLLLSAVYTSTLMYWLNDESSDFSDTNAFLDRRIENVMQLGSLLAGKYKRAG